MTTQRRRSIIDDNKRQALSSTAEIDLPDATPEEETAQAPPARDKGDCMPADRPNVVGRPKIESSPIQPRGPPADRRRQRTHQPFNYDAEGDCFTIEEFCLRHRISPQLYYKMKQKGLTPREFRVGARVLISKEAAAEWRKEREKESAAAGRRQREAAAVDKATVP
jgi:hypothetical protein